MSDLREQMAAGAVAPSMESGDVFKFTTPGETVCGEVIVAKFDIVTKYGEADLIEVSDDKRGQVTVWLTNAQLRAGLVDGRNQIGRRVDVGDKVFIRFDGVTALEDGKSVKNYSINVQAAGPPSAGAGIAAAPTQVAAPAGQTVPLGAAPAPGDPF